MRPLGNDRWQGEFKLEQRGTYDYTVVRVARCVRDLAGAGHERSWKPGRSSMSSSRSRSQLLRRPPPKIAAPEHRQTPATKLPQHLRCRRLDQARRRRSRLDLMAAPATQTLLRSAAPRPFDADV